MSNVPLYILPGEARFKDRIVPSELVEIQKYAPSKDMSLSEEDRRYRPDCLKVTVRGEDVKVYPFVLPCHFRPEWMNLEVAARDMGRELAVSDPVKDEDSIGHSIIRIWFATADGAVYTAKSPGGSDLLITEELPIRLDPVWIEEQMAGLAHEHPRMGG